MAAGHTWGKLSFGTAAVVGGIEFVRELRQFAHEVVDGVDVVDMGARGAMVQLRGKHHASDIEELLGWFRSCWAAQDTTATLDLWGGGFPLEGVILRRFRFLGLRPAVGGGYYGHYSAAFFVPVGAAGDGEPL